MPSLNRFFQSLSISQALQPRSKVAEGQFCQQCQEVLDQSFGYERNPLEDAPISAVPHHGSAGSLYSAAARGCYICSHIWNTYLGVEYQTLLSQGNGPLCYTELSEISRGVMEAVGFRLRFSPVNGRPGTAKDISFEIRHASGMPSGDLPVYVQEMSAQCARSACTVSESTWPLISDWLQRCAANHVSCRKSTTDGFVPTRLIDVGLGGDPIRLEAMSKPKGPYLALSHCWGPGGLSEAFKTTNKNITDMLREIKEEQLPKNFRDSVAICRGLGVRYIWIDALCIIQGDLEDWNREGSMMNKVYRNALFTIAASDSTDGNGGCVYPRLEPFWRPVWLPGDEKHFIFPRVNFLHFLRNRPLAQRAWAYQERMLSPRVLHFTNRGVLMECRESLSSDGFPLGVPLPKDDLEEENLFNWKQLLSQVESVASQNLVNGPIHLAWYDIVEFYSRCFLTHWTDKFFALNAITSSFEPVLGRLTAGHWDRLSPWDFMWVTASRDANRPTEYIAPSWSWASVNGRVSYQYARYTLNGQDSSLPIGGAEGLFPAKLLAVDTTPCPSNKNGAISAGFLRLRGRVLPVTIASGPIAIETGVSTSYPVRFPGKGVSSRGLPGGWVFEHVAGRCYDMRMTLDPPHGPEDAVVGPRIHCFLLVCNYETMAFGLLLQNCEGGDSALRRVGLFHLSWTLLDGDDKRINLLGICAHFMRARSFVVTIH